MNSLLIRCDTSSTIGSGHAMRCLALAQAAQERGVTVTFLMSEITPFFRNKLDEEDISFSNVNAEPGSEGDADTTAQIVDRDQPDWLVLDGYHFDSVFQDTVSEYRTPILYIDDYGHCDSYPVTCLLNQNLSADEQLYPSVKDREKLLLGPEYILIRRQFLEHEPTFTPGDSKSPDFLICLGGSDPTNTTGFVLEALSGRKGLFGNITVVTDSRNDQLERIKTLADNLSAELHTDVTDMATLMAEADLAISAGGSINWELAYMGIPSLVIVLADNQEEIARSLEDRGISINLGWYSNLDEENLQKTLDNLISQPDKRTDMSIRARDLVDGKGADRVLDRLDSLREP